ncbi:hypothetical protein F4824DRAFT_491556 [Ustulina deusta]|nr:hypothetical protein F4824DRAFT_491556 [Ustulina deusta]
MEMAMTHDVGTLAAVAGATAGAATARRSQAPYYRSPRSTVSTFDAASYMNHLRAPVPSRIPASHGAGVGIHIHYQGQCPHDVAHGSSYPGDILNSHSEGYGYPQDHHNPLYPYYEGSPSSPCGCPRCYWRDFYYVGRVREVYDNHCEHHRLLFRDICLMWELPEKITLPEEEDAPHMSRALTPHSRHSSPSPRRTPIPLSRGPTPLSRESGDRLGVAAVKVSKGKEKEVINTGLDGGADTPDGSIDEDNKGKKVEMKTPPTTTPSEIIAKPQPKPSKTSMQQRFRQFWSTRTREKALEMRG